ncbi:hypothetical protein B0J14DRAFT_223002 [Halenospora varia]|nr:hypothetical protein B0J14DRAFT_223002 [Halenospora varia]
MAETDCHIHDVIIVGAGTCGLAVAARLCEATPSSLFSESEHQRYHWMKASSSSKRSSKLTRTSRRSNTAPDRLLSGPGISCKLDIAVLDETSGQWMGAWNDKFEKLDISHLRSPMFFHPDPRDRDGLLEFVYREGREGELREIAGVVGKGLSKHQRKKKVKNSGKRGQETTYLDERDRKDFFRPSQAVFKQHCEDIAGRYNLTEIVEKSKVSSISYNPHGSINSGIFTLQTSTGTRKARVVIFAAGAASQPSLPPNCPFCPDHFGSVTHAFAKDTVKLPKHVLDKISKGKETKMAVVGGGLTSAQVTATAISSGVSKVYHLVRGPLKVKHFDVDLDWVGKYKNFHLASFWSADSDEERLQMIKDARGGGSVNPEYKKILDSLVKDGKVELLEYAEITGGIWDEGSQTWTLETSPKLEGLQVDHIIYATGMVADFASIPSLQPLHQIAPINSMGGLPCITDELMWNEDIPFFFTGRLAGLRLGPAAGNLEGARQGAERIAGRFEELLRDYLGKRGGGGDGEGWDLDEGEEEVDMRRLGLGRENQFAVLEV